MKTAAGQWHFTGPLLTHVNTLDPTPAPITVAEVVADGHQRFPGRKTPGDVSVQLVPSKRVTCRMGLYAISVCPRVVDATRLL